MPPLIESTRRFLTSCLEGSLRLGTVGGEVLVSTGTSAGPAGKTVGLAASVAGIGGGLVGGVDPAGGAPGARLSCVGVNKCLTLVANTLLSMPSFQTVSWNWSRPAP